MFYPYQFGKSNAVSIELFFCAKGNGKAVVKLFVATIGIDFELASKTVDLTENEQIIF